MKKIICFIVLMSLICSMCYAAEQKVTYKVHEFMPRDEFLSGFKYTLDHIKDDAFINIKARTEETYFSVQRSSFFKGGRNELTSEEKEALLDVVTTLYDSIISCAFMPEGEVSQEVMAKHSKTPSLLSVQVSGHTDSGVDCFASITEVGIHCTWGFYYTEEPQKIISAVEDTIYLHRDVLLGQPEDPVFVNTDEMQITERLSFEIPVTSELSNTIFCDFGDVGDSLKCAIEQVKAGRKELFLFNIDGDKKSETYYTGIPSAIDWSSGNAGNSIEFVTGDVMENSNLYNNVYEREWKKVNFIFTGRTDGKTLTDVFLTVESWGMGKSIENVKVNNITYEFFKNSNSTVFHRSICSLFGASEEELKNTMIKYKGEQDPERYVTQMRNFDEYDGSVLDFYISFIAQADVNITTAKVPEWFKNLGSNVKLAVVGITQTLNGNDRRNYIMLRYSGDNGMQWFDLSTSQRWNDKKNKELFVRVIFNSLLSFDGFAKVENILDYEKTAASIYFEDSEDMDFLGVSVEIGDNDIRIPESEFSYIGGGKLVYEKLW